MNRGKLNGDISFLAETSSNALTDCADESLLGRLFGVINTQDVLTFWLGLVDLFDHAGKVGNVNGWHEVVALTHDRKAFGVLEPCALEVAVEDGLSLSVKDTSRDNVSLNVFLFEIEDHVFSLLHLCVLLGALTHSIVSLGKCVVQELLVSAERRLLRLQLRNLDRKFI